MTHRTGLGEKFRAVVRAARFRPKVTLGVIALGAFATLFEGVGLSFLFPAIRMLQGDIARVDEFLNDLPDGYETLVGDDGVRLSGGQRQRVPIARALLKDAGILVLDEATSELDTALEAEVYRGIESLEDGYLTVVVAHRFPTVTGADRIYTFEGGRITEVGDHEQLVAADGTYAELYDMQVRL